jgi:hypothetical protein
VSGTVVNQWAGGYAQGTTIATLVPVLQSCVVPLTSASSVGGGSGTPTAGNWLFTVVTWTQDPALANVHVGIGDDIRSWWREYPAAGSGGNTRTTIAYTPNTIRPAGNIYVAPDGQISAISVLVVEVSGLGPWDTVGTGAPDTNYAAAATSLGLSLGAPGAASFWIAAVGGDNVSSGQALTPAGWTALHTVTETNGVNHATDSILTSAYLASSSSSQSITGTASSEDMSGFMLAVWTTGGSPIPAGQNPDWPYVKAEAGFGSGFTTPDSEVTWTDLTSRLWSWHETTGVQYQLGQIQATDLTLELDNNDNALTSSNTSSPYYPYCTDGTPLRLRFAIGTIGGVTENRWYVWQRNAQDWNEGITEDDRRRYAEVTGTDLWAALGTVPPTFYRAEIYADGPYAWWPMDDQALASGVLPVQLLNAAPGNTNPLDITLSPSGSGPSAWYSTTGTSLPYGGVTPYPSGSGAVTGPPGVAVYTVGASSGWLFGDPVGQPFSYASSGGAITASPGSYAWQASGQCGNSGNQGWFLICNDASFPALSTGVTVEGWFSYPFLGSTDAVILTSSFDNYVIAQQPYSTLTLWELLTGTEPVCELQLTTAGHLQLITYSGATATTHSIYTASDLRSGSWHHYAVTMTTTAWTVYVDGGITATIAGTATGMTSAWTWLVVNGDLGANGGSSAGTGLEHGGNVSAAHFAVYPVMLPAWRILAHYAAGITGWGLLPAPSGISVTAVDFSPGTINDTGTLSPDGQFGQFTSGYGASGPTFWSMSAVAVAQAGAVTSGPSAWAVAAHIPYQPSTYADGDNAFVSWTGVAPGFAVYSGTKAGSETQAAIVSGNSDAFAHGYGSSADSYGIGYISAGSGASPPSAPTALGDSVGQRIERLMLAGRCISPNRCIDPSALLVQAPGTAGGGTQAGDVITELQQSDSGGLYIDNLNNLTYWQRTHLAGQYSSPLWAFGPSGGSEDPYYKKIKWIADPQRVWTVIQISPFSPDGAQLPIITPTDTAAVEAAQLQYGAQPQQIQSWLQSTAQMQLQANWLLDEYGQPVRRIENLKIDAAPAPSLWPAVAAISVGDLASAEDWQIGGGGSVYTYRISQLERHVEYGGQTGEVVASVVIRADYEPSSYWS